MMSSVGQPANQVDKKSLDLTQNLRKNKLWAKYHRKKVLVPRIKLLSQEMNKCHRNKVPCRMIEYLPDIYKKILVTCINYWSL